MCKMFLVILGSVHCSWWEGGGDLFNTLFLRFFPHKSYIARIIAVVRAQQKHKDMFLKHEGEGDKIFLQCHGGGRFFHVYSRGVDDFFLPIDFAKPPHPSAPCHK